MGFLFFASGTIHSPFNCNWIRMWNVVTSKCFDFHNDKKLALLRKSVSVRFLVCLFTKRIDNAYFVVSDAQWNGRDINLKEKNHEFMLDIVLLLEFSGSLFFNITQVAALILAHSSVHIKFLEKRLRFRIDIKCTTNVPKLFTSV